MSIPSSIGVILALPLPQLADFTKDAAVKDKLIAYATKHPEDVSSGVLDVLRGPAEPVKNEPRTPEYAGEEQGEDAMDVDS